MYAVVRLQNREEENVINENWKCVATEIFYPFHASR